MAVETLHDRCAECAGRVTGNAKASAVDAIKERVVGGDRSWITAGAGLVFRVRLIRRRVQEVDCFDQTGDEHRGVDVAALAAARRLPIGTALAARVVGHDEIGRASWRERECQYV